MVLKIQHVLGLRAIYALAPGVDPATTRLFQNYFIVKREDVLHVKTKIMGTVDRPETGGASIRTLRAVLGVGVPAGVSSEEVLHVKALGRTPKLTTQIPSEFMTSQNFLVPFMLPYMERSQEKFQREIALSWANGPRSPKRQQAVGTWMPIFEKCHLHMEGKTFPYFCRACKNIFNKLVDGCSVQFLNSTDCRMGLNLAKDPAVYEPEDFVYEDEDQEVVDYQTTF